MNLRCDCPLLKPSWPVECTLASFLYFKVNRYALTYEPSICVLKRLALVNDPEFDRLKVRWSGPS